MPPLEQLPVTLHERFEATRRSLLEELEFQRSENRKIKLLVEGARRAQVRACVCVYEPPPSQMALAGRPTPNSLSVLTGS